MKNLLAAARSLHFVMGRRLETMFDQKDFVPKTLSVHWLKGIQADTFDSAIAAANEWIEAESIDVLNIETIVLPVGSNDETETPNITGAPLSIRQFIRVWYRKS
jgi:hypothetical protein